MGIRVLRGAPLVCALLLAACGGDEGTSAGGGGSGATVKGAKAIDVSLLDKPASGTVTYCAGKDTTGSKTKSVADFNARYASQASRPSCSSSRRRRTSSARSSSSGRRPSLRSATSSSPT